MVYGSTKMDSTTSKAKTLFVKDKNQKEFEIWIFI
jgi:hypothetical protein